MLFQKVWVWLSSLSIYLLPTVPLPLFSWSLFYLRILSSFDVTMISAFTMFSWSLFLNSGSSSFTGLIECLSQNYVFSKDQRKAGSLNHLFILLKFLESSPWDASSAGLSCVDTYCHWWTSVWSRINCTRLAMKTLNLWDWLLIQPKTIWLSVQSDSGVMWMSSSSFSIIDSFTERVAAVSFNLGIETYFIVFTLDFPKIKQQCLSPFSFSISDNWLAHIHSHLHQKNDEKIHNVLSKILWLSAS